MERNDESDPMHDELKVKLNAVKGTLPADWNVEFYEAVKEESDRGCVLVGASYLEFLLTEVLASIFIDDSKITKPILSSSFFHKLNLCRALDLISELQYKDMNIIRQMRNQFAHLFENRNFEDESRCTKLYFFMFFQQIV